MPKSPPANFAGGCSNEKCSIRDPWPLHHMSRYSNICRYCTSCVLNLHPGFFCTICFSLLDPPPTPLTTLTPPPLENPSIPPLPTPSRSSPPTPPPSSPPTATAPPPSTLPLPQPPTPSPATLLMPPSPREIIKCQRCSMVCHFSCLQSNPDSASTYICPSCKDPSFVYFPKFSGGEKVVDFEAAKVLRLAGKLSLISMEKAVQVAKNESDRKAKEAVEAKKRVREILERGSLVTPKKVGSKRKSKEADNSRESYPMDREESMALSVLHGVLEKSILSGCSELQREDSEKEGS